MGLLFQNPFGISETRGFHAARRIFAFKRTRLHFASDMVA